jgi:hypothetical protein
MLPQDTIPIHIKRRAVIETTEPLNKRINRTFMTEAAYARKWRNKSKRRTIPGQKNHHELAVPPRLTPKTKSGNQEKNVAISDETNSNIMLFTPKEYLDLCSSFIIFDCFLFNLSS